MLLDEEFEIELHGVLTLDSVRDLTGQQPDLFSLMVTRAAMLGWSSPATSLQHRPRLWHPASAEVEECEQTRTQAIWAHVIPEDVPAAAASLMIQPVTRCLADCADRLGRLRLHDVRIAVAVGGPVDLTEIQGATWFRDPAEWSEVIVTPELVRAPTEIDLVDIVAKALEGSPGVRLEPRGRELVFQVPHWSVDIGSWLAALVLAALSQSGLSPAQRLRMRLHPERQESSVVTS